MPKITLTPGSKKFKLLAWMMDRSVSTYGEIQRFLCELSGYDYDKMETENVWKKVREPIGNGHRYQITGTKQVRRYRGIWSTNLSSGRDPILRNYCERTYKNGKYIGWAVKPDVQAALQAKRGQPKSSLEADFPSDEIPNNSKVVERKVIRLLDVDTNKQTYWTPKASTVDKIMAGLNLPPTREELLTASRLGAKVNKLVALQEEHANLKKEYLDLVAERDRIEQRMLDVMNARERIKKEANAFFED